MKHEENIEKHKMRKKKLKKMFDNVQGSWLHTKNSRRLQCFFFLGMWFFQKKINNQYWGLTVLFIGKKGYFFIEREQNTIYCRKLTKFVAEVDPSNNNFFLG